LKSKIFGAGASIGTGNGSISCSIGGNALEGAPFFLLSTISRVKFPGDTGFGTTLVALLVSEASVVAAFGATTPSIWLSPSFFIFCEF
jgi:hypothetical protein